MCRYLFLTALVVTTISSAAQCCSGGVPMSGNLGLPAADAGTWQFSVSYDLNELRTLKTGSQTTDDSDRNRQTHSILGEVGYSFSEKWSADLFFSWVKQERAIESPSGGTNFTSTQGVGDAVLLVKYRPVSALQVGYGIKAPLGSADQTREDGVQLTADLQPGSGAWDHIAYLNFTKQNIIRPTTTLTTTLTHRWRGVNNDYLGNSTYQFGNEFMAIAAIADRLVVGSVLLDPSLKVRYRQATRDTFNNFDFASSGGEFLFINPGLAWVLSPSINWQVNMEWPLYARVNEVQLAPTLRFNTGLFIQINPSSKIF